MCIHSQNLHTSNGCISSDLKAVLKHGDSRHLGVVCSHLAAAPEPAGEELSSATRAEHVCCACTPRSGCSTPLTHPNQGVWHKYLLSQQTVSPEGKRHQDLKPPTQCTHCSWVTNPIISLVLSNNKCWASKHQFSSLCHFWYVQNRVFWQQWNTGLWKTQSTSTKIW